MRRYAQFHATPALVAAIPSVGSAETADVVQTVARRRYPQFGSTPSMAKTLPSVLSADENSFIARYYFDMLGQSNIGG